MEQKRTRGRVFVVHYRPGKNPVLVILVRDTFSNRNGSLIRTSETDEYRGISSGSPVSFVIDRDPHDHTECALDVRRDFSLQPSRKSRWQ